MEYALALSFIIVAIFVFHVIKTVKRDRQEHREFIKELRRSGFIPPYEPGSTRREL